MRTIKDKKAAIELSIGTIVIIVLAMSMLILGLVLIQSIFSGAKYNVDQMNNKVRDEINKLFVEDKKTVVYLPNQLAEIKQNEDWGIAFAIKNLAKGVSEEESFNYDVVSSDPRAQANCGIGIKDIENWIVTGQSDTIKISPGDTYHGVVRFMIPEGAPLCTTRFHLDVRRVSEHYATDFFDVEVLGG